MSWYKNIIRLSSGNVPLTVNSLKSLISDNENDIIPDVLNQQYLFSDDEFQDLKQFRYLVNNNHIKQVLSIFQTLFEFFGDAVENEYDWDREIDSSYFDDEIYDIAAQIVRDSNFNDQSISSLIEYLVENRDQDEISECVFSVLELYKKIEKHDREKVINSDLVSNIIKYIGNRLHDPYYEELNNYLSVLPKTEPSEEYLKRILEPIEKLTTDYITDYKKIPPWISEHGFIKAISNEIKTEWYVSEHRYGYGGLQESSEESYHENEVYELNSSVKRLDHKYGFDIFDLMCKEYNKSDPYDDRNNISLSVVSSFIDDVRDLPLQGMEYSHKTAETNEWHTIWVYDVCHALIGLMTDLLVSGSNDRFPIKNVFSEDLSRIVFHADDSSRITSGIYQMVSLLKLPILGIIPDSVNNSISKISNMSAEDIKKLHIDTGKEEVSFSDTVDKENLRNIGIKQPFSHDLHFDKKDYPGSGRFKNLINFPPFTVGIVPTEEFLISKNIPHDLLRDMNLHRINESNSSLGWIGGHADIKTKTLYITEIQSDVMQRTGYMRDEEKVTQQRYQEATKIREEIKLLDASMSNAISPKQQIKNTLDRIISENKLLNSESQKFKSNNILIDKLLHQYQAASDSVDISKIEQKKIGLQNKLKSLLNKRNGDKDTDDGHYVRDFSKWHDYKTIVENSFKDWIKVFFNTIFRVARNKGYSKIRVISSESLMQIWKDFSREKTQYLFDRIYNQTCASYGAELVDYQGRKWWELNMNNPSIKIANWLSKLYKQATEDWMVKMPNGGFVWQVHLDTFFNVFGRKFGKDTNLINFQEETNNYETNELNRFIFGEWLEEVPDYLKINGDLKPDFRNQVRQYLKSKYSFDPYEFDSVDKDISSNTHSNENPNDQIEIPSASDLEQWWN